jgi:hypothetical protein
MLTFFAVVVVVALIVWGLSLLPLGAFQQVIFVAGICVVVFAFFQYFLGIDLAAHIRSVLH